MLYLKAAHIVFVVTWFAALFYLPRLLIYQREAQDKDEPKREILTQQFSIMARRLLYGIMWPSAIITLILGLTLVSYYLHIPSWLWLKFGFVLCLYIYHFMLHRRVGAQNSGDYSWSSMKLRFFNEIPTVFLVAIVFLVVVRSEIGMLWGVGGLVALVLLLMMGIKVYKIIRKG